MIFDWIITIFFKTIVYKLFKILGYSSQWITLLFKSKSDRDFILKEDRQYHQYIGFFIFFLSVGLIIYLIKKASC